MQDAMQGTEENSARDVAIAAKRHTGKAFFRRRLSSPTLKRHHFQQCKTAKHARVMPRRFSAGKLESAVSQYYTVVLDWPVAGCSL